MTTYVEQVTGFILDEGGLSIPNDTSNRHYAQALSEVEAGTSIITAYDGTADALSALVSAEVLWVSQELVLADIEINKVIDSDVNAMSSEGDLRTYRKELRAHNRDPGYPNEARPTINGGNL